MTLGADLVAETVQNIIQGKIKPIPQEQMHTDEPLRPAPKIFRETCQIIWTDHTVESAHNFIRGLSPYPGAWTTIITPDGKETTMKIYKTKKNPSACKETNEQRTNLYSDSNKNLCIRLTDGELQILELQLAGKKKMNASDFLRGTSIEGWSLK
jgi:methionyl-tRNA formyltransferase